MAASVGVVAERDLEKRVALTPAVVATLVGAGTPVHVETGAGRGAGHLDEDYEAAGASIGSRATALAADVVVCVRRPDSPALAEVSDGAVLLGLLEPARDTEELDSLAARGVRVMPFERLPRQVSRAQTMDALSSQASIAGYRAAIVAAEAYGRYFPMMVTAAGTAKPATVLVLGAGVAGLQAIATARRLGARVTGYDVRPAAREEVTSLGAQFLETSISAIGEGGYARELTSEESTQQRAELAQSIAKFDVVITTAKVPGRRPPELVDAETVAAMRRGSVVVDLAAGPWGGNVAGVVADERTVTDGGVTLIGAGEIAAQMAPAASDAYAKNVAAVLAALMDGTELAVDSSDEVIGALLGTAEEVA